MPPAVQCETGQHQVSHLPTALTDVRVGRPVSELLLSRSRFSQVFLMMKRNLIQLDDILQISPADDEVEPSTSHASHLTVIGIGANELWVIFIFATTKTLTLTSCLEYNVKLDDFKKIPRLNIHH